MDVQTIDSPENPNQLRADMISLVREADHAVRKYLKNEHTEKIKPQDEVFHKMLILEAVMKKLMTKMVSNSSTTAKDIALKAQSGKLTLEQAQDKLKELASSLQRVDRDCGVGVNTSLLLQGRARKAFTNLRSMKLQAPHENLGKLPKGYKNKIKQLFGKQKTGRK
jgi:hypothetical protein